MGANPGTTRTVTLIYGPPCSGKTTYVRELAHHGDIIVDWDDLAREAGSTREHDHLPQYAAAAGRRRMELERDIADMTTGTAWIIRTLGNPTERQQAAERLRATLLRIDPGGAECIHRAHHTGRPPATDELIIRWYADDWASRALTTRIRGGALQQTAHPGLT